MITYYDISINMLSLSSLSVIRVSLSPVYAKSGGANSPNVGAPFHPWSYGDNKPFNIEYF